MNNNKNRIKKLLNQGTLYGITASQYYLNGNVDAVEKLLSAGVKIIQYREKAIAKTEMERELHEIKKQTTLANAILIVNDHPELCRIVNADGVHIGQTDGNAIEIRKLLGDDKIIGLSTHCPKHAHEAERLPIDYIGVGPAFKTLTKPDKEVAGLNYIKYVANHISLPKVAIGGINMKNIENVLQQGIKSVCMIQSLFNSEDDLKKIAKEILAQIKEFPS